MDNITVYYWETVADAFTGKILRKIKREKKVEEKDIENCSGVRSR